MWGVFDDTREVHVAPCNKDRYLLSGHELSKDCCCQPELELIPDRDQNLNPLYIHNEVH